MKLTKVYLKQIIVESLQELREADEDIELPPAAEEELEEVEPAEEEEGDVHNIHDVARTRTQAQAMALQRLAMTPEAAATNFPILMTDFLKSTQSPSSNGLLALRPDMLIRMFRSLLGEIHPQSKEY